MLFASWVVRVVKNSDRRVENAVQGRWQRAKFSSPRSCFFNYTDRPLASIYPLTDLSQITF